MENNEKNDNKKLKIIIGILTTILVVLAATLIYFVFIKKESPNQQGNEKIVEYQNEKEKIKTVSKNNTDQYQKIYAKAKKAYEDYAEESGLDTTYPFDGDYYVIDEEIDIIVEITKIREDDKYAIFEGHQPGDDYPSYVYIINKEQKSIEDVSEIFSDGANFIELKGKYYFFDTKHDYSDFCDIYSEDLQFLGYGGRLENVVFDSALYYLVYENNTIYLANTNGLKKQVLENFQISRVITEITRDDDIIDVKIYEKDYDGEDVICSFQYITYRDEIKDLDFNHDYADSNRLSKSPLVVDLYDNHAWDSSMSGTAIFDDGTLYTWNYNESQDGAFNDYIKDYDINTLDGLKEFILDKGSRSDVIIPNSKLDYLKTGISHLEDDIDYIYSCPGADMGQHTLSINKNGNLVAIGQYGDCVGYSTSQSVVYLISTIGDFIDTSYYEE